MLRNYLSGQRSKLNEANKTDRTVVVILHKQKQKDVLVMKWKSPKTLGNELETMVKTWLDESGIPYEQESTITQNGKRSKGSVDFKLTNPVGFIECKRYTDRLTFKCRSEIHDIKWSQVEFLYKNRECEVCGFVVKEASDDCCYFIPIQSFMSHYLHTESKSINAQDIKNIGMKITNLAFVKP